MKSIVLFFLSIALPLSALFVGNPAEPEIIDQGFFIPEEWSVGVKAGYQKDFVFDRNMKLRNSSKGSVNHFESNFDQGLFILNLFHRLETYVSLGAMQVDISETGFPDKRHREYETHDQLTWGVGGRLLLFNWGRASCGVDGKYQRGYPHLKACFLDGETVPARGKMLYSEWQISAAVSYEIGSFIPYAGVQYAYASAKIRDLSPEFFLPSSTIRMSSQTRVGMCLGSSFSPGKYFDCAVEVRLFDEQALTLSANIQF